MQWNIQWSTLASVQVKTISESVHHNVEEGNPKKQNMKAFILSLILVFTIASKKEKQKHFHMSQFKHRYII